VQDPWIAPTVFFGVIGRVLCVVGNNRFWMYFGING
jgi:hypothetical protein